MEVTPEKELVVRAPRRMSDGEIEKLIIEKKKWIRKKYRQMGKADIKKFVEGEEFLYLGNLYRLHYIDKEISGVFFNDGFYISKPNQNKAKQLMIDWYKTRALDWLEKRVEKYRPLIDCRVNKVKVSWAKKRWGSYSQKSKNINFNWRIVMAPLAVIDYLVVHELVHSEQPNHSKKFWRRVEEILPEYRSSKKWLKNNWHIQYLT